MGFYFLSLVKKILADKTYPYGPQQIGITEAFQMCVCFLVSFWRVCIHTVLNYNTLPKTKSHKFTMHV